MIADINSDLFSYFDAAEATTSALREADGPAVHAFKEFHRYFSQELWAVNELNPMPAMLSMHALMTYMAGVRIAMSGHAGAMFPVMRTALEAACYAYLMNANPELCTVWTERHKDTASAKRCRSAFTSAVKTASEAIGRAHLNGADFILKLYDTAIDFGAHPNIRGVASRVTFKEDDPDDPYARLTFGSIYGPDAWETRQTMIAAMDFATAIALILTIVKGPASDAIQDRLQELNGIKNDAVARLMAA